ncbi:hypothetical protein LTR37_001537 [Vermiconidia calcicola]|uniref:Uncharacterized protein n=1 Tax=Vermiconidia calcicola TaxID=1690605 RepID=A0ACC3NVD0_9PEZI|nr:hypothetical protein LTR37_001537 [Vermiconidia calcicola]
MNAGSHDSASLLGLPRELCDKIYYFAAVPESRTQLSAVKCDPIEPDHFEQRWDFEEVSAWLIVAASPRVDKDTRVWNGTATWVNLTRVSIQVANEVDEVFYKHAEVHITNICYGHYDLPRGPLVPTAAFDRFRFITVDYTRRKIVMPGTHSNDRPWLEQKLTITPSPTKDGSSELDWDFRARVFIYPARKAGWVQLTRDDTFEIQECLKVLGDQIRQLIHRKWSMCKLKGLAVPHILDLLTAPERFDVGCEALVEGVTWK